MFYLLKTLFVIEMLMAIGLVLFRWALAPRHRGLVSAKIVAVALLTPAVALFCGSIYLFCAYLAAVVATSTSRSEAAGVYLFLLPLTPILTVETRVGSVYLFGVSTVLAMGLGALIGYAVTGFTAPRGGCAPTSPRYDIAMWAIVVMFIVMYNRDLSPTGLLRGLIVNLLTFAGPYLLVSRGARGAADLERILLRLCLGATVMAVTALFQARWRWVVFEVYYQAQQVELPLVSAALSLRAGLLRTGGSMIDYSAGGLFLAAIVTLLPLLRRHFRPIGFWVVQAVLIGGLIATQSRGAWVAAIVGLVFVAAWRGQWGRVAVMAGGAVAAEVAVLAFASGQLAQIAGRTAEAGGNIDYRQLLLSRGLDQIRSHPLFGQSPEQLVANLPDLVQGEGIVDFVNGHLFIAMAAGVPAFLLWCLIWSMPVLEGWRRRRDPSLLSAVPAAILVPVTVALTFTSFADRNLTWPIIALGLAAPCLAIGRRANASRARAVADGPVSIDPPVGSRALVRLG